jgi:3-isopropylmalate dehydrogenase
MMLSALGEEKAAEAMEKAVMFITANKIKSLQAGRMGYSTAELGDLVASQVAG